MREVNMYSDSEGSCVLDAKTAHECLYAEVERARMLSGMAYKLAWRHGWQVDRFGESVSQSFDAYVHAVYDWYRHACAKLRLTVVTVERSDPHSEGHVSMPQPVWESSDLHPCDFPKLSDFLRV